MRERGFFWEILGAVVGAGFASGREVASFFARYGAWGYAGAVAAVGSIALLTDTPLPAAWRGRWPEKLWRSLFALLLVATGGAMLAAAGEVSALLLPLRPAYALGMALTLLLAWWLSTHTAAGLAWVSRMLLAALLLMTVCGLTLPPLRANVIARQEPAAALLHGLCYGGFNAAIAAPVLLIQPQKGRKGALLVACGMLLALLLLGVATLLRHPALIGEGLPFIRMMSHLGRTGYWLGGICLYLAVLSTLIACLRGLGGRLWALAGIGAVALAGFHGVVETVYPALGGACMALLLAAKLRNCAGKPFHGAENML